MAQEIAELTQRSPEAVPRLAPARWFVLTLPAPHHKKCPVECAAYCESGEGRVGCNQQPYLQLHRLNCHRYLHYAENYAA